MKNTNKEKNTGQDMIWEWLCSIPSLRRPQIEILLRCFSDPEGIYLASDSEFEYLEKKGIRWIGKVRQFQQYSAEMIMHRNRENGIEFISNMHPKYPGRLKKIKEAPFGLFYRGKLPENNRKSVAIVGARLCTRQGKERAEQLAAAIALAGGQVISGAAYGIDGNAQWAALESGGRSFAVLGCGADQYYPRSNRTLFERLERDGGILSEYAPGAPPMPVNFPFRNRIISGLSDVVAVIEARTKSGSLITADYAAEQGIPVMAFPGRPEDELSSGCNELINQGAGVILSVESFIKLIFSDNINNKNKLTEDFALAPAEKLVYSSFGLHSKSIWELAECTVLSLAELSECLLLLEGKGLIKESEQGRYIRIR